MAALDAERWLTIPRLSRRPPMHGSECNDPDIETPAAALCQNCGRALCPDCLDSRPGPGGMTNIGRRHGRTVFLLSGGLRVAARAA
jgi:hypothetical protein